MARNKIHENRLQGKRNTKTDGKDEEPHKQLQCRRNTKTGCKKECKRKQLAMKKKLENRLQCRRNTKTDCTTRKPIANKKTHEN